MDPVTLMTALSIGAVFCLNRLATVVSTRKQKDAGGTAAGEQSNGIPEKRVGGGDRSEPRDDARGQARVIPPVDLRGLNPPAGDDAGETASASAVVEVRSVRDVRSGKFVKRATPAAA